ncbi:hypothetical protein PRZ48_008433 [Zasmidium cellare]|uniref:SnoaL-like domain-containing protein n=1 Tax=Zasmidium cellare TaxID=395010 RepID=A0ABR0EFG6_ZASCE|nr:hypothetical protein PRZ48_008433 [Zasmidium cellare]
MTGCNPSSNPLELEAALYLESILTSVKRAINTGDWDDVRHFFAPEFTCQPVFRPCSSGPDVSQGLCGLEEYIKMCRSVLPAMATEIVNVVTDVDLRHGRAASFTTFRTIGVPEGVVRHSVGRFQWRRIQGEWKLTSHMSARGMEVE